MSYRFASFPCFFFNDTATTEIYTLSLHDALPILRRFASSITSLLNPVKCASWSIIFWIEDRKSTRLNSSHTVISYAVFCLKKKKKKLEQKRIGHKFRARQSTPPH